jgi:hypothetical protein
MISNDSATQGQRVHTALQNSHCGLTTIELREQFDVLHRIARIQELRQQQGLKIETIWAVATNAQGNQHRVVRYVLKAGKWVML